MGNELFKNIPSKVGDLVKDVRNGRIGLPDALSRATGSSAFVAGCDSAIFLVVWLKKNGAV